MRILLADIGGTNARFALYQAGEITHFLRLATADYGSPVVAARAYLAEIGTEVRHAAMALPGPVSLDQPPDRVIPMVNAGWQTTAREIRDGLGLEQLLLYNDFVAQAHALPYLFESDMLRLGGEQAQIDAPRLVLGPGTGLGLAALIPLPPEHCSRPWLALPGEGGHQTLAAETEREAQILVALRSRRDAVSWQDILSGPGLLRLYRQLCALESVAPICQTPQDVLEISADEQASEARALFCGWLGSVAGNAALSYAALGGVYLSGGVAQALASDLLHSPFRSRFEHKPPLQDWLRPIPTCLITREDTAFLGLKALLEGEADFCGFL